MYFDLVPPAFVKAIGERGGIDLTMLLVEKAREGPRAFSTRPPANPSNLSNLSNLATSHHCNNALESVYLPQDTQFSGFNTHY